VLAMGTDDFIERYVLNAAALAVGARLEREDGLNLVRDLRELRRRGVEEAARDARDENARLSQSWPDRVRMR
jgi:hypothetical protein